MRGVARAEQRGDIHPAARKEARTRRSGRRRASWFGLGARGSRRPRQSSSVSGYVPGLPVRLETTATRRPSTRARRPRAFVGTEIATTVTAAPAMACSAAALATPVFTTASRPCRVSKSSRGVPDVGGPAARRHPARSLAPRASTDAASAATAISWPEGAGAAEIGATKATASVANLGARGEIATGLPFLDHMIDQLTSHAQLGVSVVVSRDGVASVPCIDASGTDEQDEAVARAAGAALGQALAQTLAFGVAAFAAAGTAGSRRVRRAAGRGELDVRPPDVARGGAPGSLRFELAPYGPGGSSGRARIGTYKTAPTESAFWSEAPASANPVEDPAEAQSWDNAHHIVEATFKAFARCTRALMDQIEFEAGGGGARLETDATNALERAARTNAYAAREEKAARDEGNPSTSPSTDGRGSRRRRWPPASRRSTPYPRDGGGGVVPAERRRERRPVDRRPPHHGGRRHHRRAGAERGVTKTKPLVQPRRAARRQVVAGKDDAAVEVIADLSNRPLCNGLVFREETIGDLSAEMVDHLFMSVAANAQMTAHILRADPGGGDEADAGGARDAPARVREVLKQPRVALDPRRAPARWPAPRGRSPCDTPSRARRTRSVR